MSNDAITRWTVSVSKDTDIVVRSFLAQRGMKKGDLSKFIEEAVKWRVFDQTVAEVRGKFADVPPEALEALIDEAVIATRLTSTPKGRVTRAAGHRHQRSRQCVVRSRIPADPSHLALARRSVRPADLVRSTR